MKRIFNFISNAGKLKGKERRGWVMHGIKNSETTAEHTFHLALLVWLVARKKKNINVDQAIKMALVHDLCEVYAKDITPYDPLLPDDLKEAKKVLRKWPKFTPELKKKKEKDKYQMELKGLEKLISSLPLETAQEIKNIWLEYEKKSSPEARFVKQADKMINFLQGIEYWKKQGKIKHKLWVRWIKEIIDDPALLDFLKEIEDNLIDEKK
jgi:putative hydrolases of HD superfamily